MHGRVVPERGAEVVASAYWRRLELDGDVEIKAPGILPPLHPDLTEDEAPEIEAPEDEAPEDEATED